MIRLRRLLMSVLAAWSLAGMAEAKEGILLLAHGQHGAGGHGAHAHHADAPSNPWNANVDAVAAVLDKKVPTEVAFGMAEPDSIQAAIDRLQKRGVTHIAAVPLFVSSHSPIIGNTRYILGLDQTLARHTSLTTLERARIKAKVAMSQALDAHPYVSEILLDRARTLTANPKETAVVLIAHGPNAEEENNLWLKDMATHAAYLREKGGYVAVEVLTHRNDAPPDIKAKAREDFRTRVSQSGRTRSVVVVPLLMSAGGIEGQVQDDLEGLSFRFAEPLLPHPNITRWVEAQAATLWAEMAAR